MKEEVFNEFETISGKIDKSSLGEKEKNVLKKVFKALKQHEEKCLQEIVNNINSVCESLDYKNWGRVYITLVPQKELEEWKNRGFYAIFPDESFSSEIFTDAGVFGTSEKSYGLRIYDGSYEEYIAFLNSNSVKVKHVPSNTEKILFDVWDRSGIKSPAIFAPWLRRICRVCDDSVDDSHFLRDHVPVWNVEFSKADKISDGKVSPDGDEYNYHQQFRCIQSAFIYVADDLADDINYKVEYEPGKKVAEVYSIGRCDFQNVKMINIHTVDDSVLKNIKTQSFSTIWEHKCNTLPVRLFSKGDICGLLGCFSTGQYRCVFSSERDKNLKIVKRYEASKGLRYPYDTKERDLEMKHRQKSICYIEFYAPQKWLTDYAEYVLSFMEYFYPEFVWVGVVK